MNRQNGTKCSAPARGRRWKRRIAHRLPAAVGFAVALLSASHAFASLYYVYTSSISAMTLNSNDGYCSLAEAIASANAGTRLYDCQDQDVASTVQTIELREAANRPFAQNHFVVSSFNITGTRGQIRINGSGAFIDTTGVSAFKVAKTSSLFMQRLTLTFTGGASGGRFIENYGTLSIYGLAFTKGNVTAQPNGFGGAIYTEGTITDLGNSLFTGNKAKRGGAIYVKDGTITNLNAIIQSNSATMAGGGLYLMSTTNNSYGMPAGQVLGGAATITGNSAPTGGGVFINQGWFSMQSTAITFNKAMGTGSQEHFQSGQSCDGKGGGATAVSSTRSSAFNLSSSSQLSNNTASGPGGGVYNTGTMALEGITISGNSASTGAAIYHDAGGPTHYCDIHYSDATGPSSVDGNRATAPNGYSIVQTVGQVCQFRDYIQVPGSGNTYPYCAPGSVKPGDNGSPDECPQH